MGDIANDCRAKKKKKKEKRTKKLELDEHIKNKKFQILDQNEKMYL
jgi:hypothetical protein